MRILLVHNFYGSTAPSGENSVFEAEKYLLQSHGHEVGEFTRHSDEIRDKGFLGKIHGGLVTPWNPSMVKAIRRAVGNFRPDVVHVHNTFPLLSPAVFWGIENHVATVMTLHNYRLFCVSALLTREQRVCTLCIDQQSLRPALIHRCYRNSFVATVPLAISIGLHRNINTWTSRVDAFSVMTENQKQIVVSAGLPRERVFVKPNFYSHHPIPLPWPEREDYVLYIGRLTNVKGVTDLIDAWSKWGETAPELRMVGDGPLRANIESIIAQSQHGKVKLLGFLPEKEKLQQLAKAKLLIMPSLEHTETFGLVLVEAFAYGVPVAVSNVTPLNLVSTVGQNSIVFEPANSNSLLQEVRATWKNRELLMRLSKGARFAFTHYYTADVNYIVVPEKV